MKAVVLNEYGGPEKLKFEDDVQNPQISGDTVLIAATAAGVNPLITIAGNARGTATILASAGRD